MVIDYRRAKPADAELLSRIAREAYAKYGERMEKAPAPVFYAYDKIIAEGWTWALTVGQAVAGMVTLVPEKDYLLLRNLAILPSFQGLGLGRLALSLAESEGRRLALPEIRLWTNVHMPENIPFYRAAGYVQTHLSERDGYRFINFSKQLDALSTIAMDFR